MRSTGVKGLLRSFQFKNSKPLEFGRRSFNLHEFQSKSLLKTFGLNVQRGDVAGSPEEAQAIARNLMETGAGSFVVKSQVLAGGRGKGFLTSGLKGGVKLCSSPEAVRDTASKMVGYNLVTEQTTAAGEPVEKVLVLESINIVKELYMAVVLDPTRGGATLIASQKGGVDIEEVLKTDPKAVVHIPIKDPRNISRDECVRAAEAIGFNVKSQNFPLNVVDQIARLFEMFLKTDATVVEINPLALTDKSPDHLVCVDAKLTFDDNAAYRQQSIAAMEDTSRVDPREMRAREFGLSFVPMNGNIGCVVNGAGLAMATMDIIQLHGGKPANFLDVGGGASVAQVTEAFRIIQSDPNVKTIFVNIFGGIMRCDIIAEALVNAGAASNLGVPLVVRLAGNRVAEAKRVLEKSKLKCSVIDDFEKAAKAACQLAQ